MEKNTYKIEPLQAGQLYTFSDKLEVSLGYDCRVNIVHLLDGYSFARWLKNKAFVVICRDFCP